MSDAPDIRHAATVVVTRQSDTDLEVLLLRRGETAGFMAGMYVYPGGRVDAADLEVAGGDPELAARWAAVRECFEEAGLLLATDAEGRIASPEQVAAVRAAGLAFPEALSKVGLVPSLGALRPFARWVTPAIERRRFDTRFYLTGEPTGQEAAVDGYEMVEHRWRRPASALEEYEAGAIVLSPPTFYFLAELAALLASGGDIAGWADVQPSYPVLPRLEVSEQPRLLLPGDADYPSEWPVPGPTRMLLVDGRWQRLTLRALP